MNDSKWCDRARDLPGNRKSTVAEELLQKLKKLSGHAQIRSHMNSEELNFRKKMQNEKHRKEYS